ncbi:MAG: hypothetical protein IJL35_13745 [Bacteroidaceae bacterium]|nr:hypothetical protein [Bacteroidaceae bacterium]MBQ6051640.1 hypothetical protein [Bacteroidaceae bacterium]
MESKRKKFEFYLWAVAFGLMSLFVSPSRANGEEGVHREGRDRCRGRTSQPSHFDGFWLLQLPVEWQEGLKGQAGICPHLSQGGFTFLDHQVETKMKIDDGNLDFLWLRIWLDEKKDVTL